LAFYGIGYSAAGMDTLASEINYINILFTGLKLRYLIHSADYAIQSTGTRR